jgi:transposase-like protein
VTRHRKHFTAEQKAAIVRRHLVDGKSVADVCEENSLQPTVFYRWQKQVFESLPALFERKNDKGQRALEDEVQRLRRTLARKDEIIAEVTGELIDAKKNSGGR